MRNRNVIYEPRVRSGNLYCCAIGDDLVKAGFESCVEFVVPEWHKFDWYATGTEATW